MVDNRGFVVRFPAGEDIFLVSVVLSPAVGPTQPLIHWVPQALSSGLKQLGRVGYHSSPSIAFTVSYTKTNLALSVFDVT
jgi:hypothetical protein